LQERLALIRKGWPCSQSGALHTDTHTHTHPTTHTHTHTTRQPTQRHTYTHTHRDMHMAAHPHTHIHILLYIHKCTPHTQGEPPAPLDPSPSCAGVSAPLTAAVCELADRLSVVTERGFRNPLTASV